MPAVRITKVMPTASKPVIDTCRITLKRLIDERNRGSMHREQRHQRDKEQRRRKPGDKAEYVDALCLDGLACSRFSHGRLIEPAGRGCARPRGRSSSPSKSPGSLRCGNLAGHPSLAHRDDAVRDGKDLRQFRRDDDNGDPGLGHLDQEIVHFDFRAESMPRVGSSTMRIFGLSASQRASTTFCWLPPDSRPAC